MTGAASPDSTGCRSDSHREHSAAGTEGATHLRRSLKLSALISIGLGIVLSQSTIVTLLQATAIGGPAFFVALAIALLIGLCYTDTFAELALMLPQAAGLGRYTEVALGPFPAIVATFAGYIIVAFFGVAAELLLVDGVVQQLFPGRIPVQVVAFSVLFIATVLNVIGVDLFARLQNFITVLKIGSMLGLGALALHATPPARMTGAHSTIDFALVLPLVSAAIWGLMGAEYICPMIEEARQPERTVPKAMWITLVLASALYLLLSLGALHLVPRERLAAAELPHLLVAETVVGRLGMTLVAITALSASLGLVSGILAAVPRLLYGMACDGQAFPVFRRLHPRFQTPWLAIAFMGLAIGAALLTLKGESKGFTVLILSAASSWLLAYIVAHLDVLVLRRRYPGMPRPYRSRWLPWPQIAGSAAMLYCLFHVSPEPALTRSIYMHAGAVLLGVALTALVWVKWVLRRELFQPTPM